MLRKESETLIEDLKCYINKAKNPHKGMVRLFFDWVKDSNFVIQDVRIFEAYRDYLYTLDLSHAGVHGRMCALRSFLDIKDVNDFFTSLHASFSWVIDYKLKVNRDKCSSGKKSKRIEFLTLKQIKLLYRKVKAYEFYREKTYLKRPVIYLMINFLYVTGLRISEMLNIKHVDCYVKDSTCMGIRIVGKGGHSRDVFVNSVLFDRVCANYKGSIYLFSNSSYLKEERFSCNSIANIFHRLGMCFLNVNISPHTFRHSYVTNVLHTLKGDYLAHNRVAKFTGHKSVKGLYTPYFHITKDDWDDFYEGLNQFQDFTQTVNV